MNLVTLIGRLTRTPELKQSQGGTSYTSFAIAIDRGKDKDGNSLGADFPLIKVFGRQAETLCKYMTQGRLIAVTGRIQTGSYENNDGKKTYTTDIIASRIEFLGGGGGSNSGDDAIDNDAEPQPQPRTRTQEQMSIEDAFMATDDEIPF